MLEFPGLSDCVRLREVGEAFAEFELAADIVIEPSNVGGRNRGGLRIVGSLLGERVNGWSGETAVKAAGGEVFVALQGMVELTGIDPQVSLENVGYGQAGVLVQLFR